MSLTFEIAGPTTNPLLLCIHGLLGGPENFYRMLEKWRDRYCPIIVDLHAHMRKEGLIDISAGNLAELTYDGAVDEILGYLERTFPGRQCYFAGLSLGGKLCYEFAGRSPETFAGAVITDVGPGTVSDSALYEFVSETIPSLNLNQPWPELKSQIAEKISDRNLRVMLQTQLHYPVKGGPAVWRAGMAGLKDIMDQQSITDQWKWVRRFAEYRQDHPDARARKFIVFKASNMSAISEAQMTRMSDFEFIEFRPVTCHTHFIHVTHHLQIEDAVLSLLD
jgi:pimeloyl-ACP methyl ester carboxylesterase